jgi:alpha-beta hydrolase superfamily lysophospholipase
MTRVEGTFAGAGALALYYQGWLPEGQARATVAIVHGVGEHSGRYGNVVRRLVACGLAAYGFDHRGHGRSPGRRGHIRHWRDYRQDLDAFLLSLREPEASHPVFLYGHSMGALIALDYLLYRPQPLQGAIISGAPMEPAGIARPWRVALARVVSRVWPVFPLRLALPPSALSRDPGVVRAYETDPLVHHVTTARWGVEALAAVAGVRQHARDMSIPILLVHGGADQVSLARGCRDLFERFTHADKAMRIYPGSYHEPHNDVDHEQVMTDVTQWLEQHL